MLTVEPRRGALARYGLDVADVQDVVSTAIGGKAVGQIFEGDQRFDLVIRLPEARAQRSARRSRRCPCRCPRAATCRCARSRRRRGRRRPERNQPRERQAPRRRDGERPRPATSARSSPTRASASSADVELPAGYWLEYGGTFEQLISGAERLAARRAADVAHDLPAALPRRSARSSTRC